MIKSGRLLPSDSPRLRLSPLQDLLAHFLGGRLDILHFLANPGARRFVSPGRLGHVFFNFLDESFQCLKFLHGVTSLWVEAKNSTEGPLGCQLRGMADEPN